MKNGQSRNSPSRFHPPELGSKRRRPGLIWSWPGQHIPHASSGILHVARAAQDHVDVAVENHLPSISAAVDTNVESGTSEYIARVRDRA